MAILISAAIYSVFAWNTLTQLISVYIWLRIATSVLTVLSAWQLRRKRPDLERAFRIPWGSKGLAYAVIAPLIMSGGRASLPATSLGSGRATLVLLLGPAAYFF